MYTLKNESNKMWQPRVYEVSVYQQMLFGDSERFPENLNEK